MKTTFFLILVFLPQLISCQTYSKSNMSTNTELIFSKQLDNNTFVECFVTNDNNFTIWEFKVRGKENKTIDRFKIDTKRLKDFSPFANRPNFYRQFRVISVFKSADNLIFLLDKFGQVDVQLYTLSGVKTIIPVKKYQLLPMDTEFIGEDFQDVKIADNTIYTLSKHLRGNNSLYYISMINLDSKKAQQAAINISEQESVAQNNDYKPVILLEDRSYQSTGFGFQFSLLDNDILYIKKDKLNYFTTKINFSPSKIDKNEDINSIIQND